MAKKEKLTYEQAMQRLESIVRPVENHEIGIDRHTETLKEARTLVKQCKTQLYAVDKDIRTILQEDEDEASTAQE